MSSCRDGDGDDMSTLDVRCVETRRSGPTTRTRDDLRHCLAAAGRRCDDRVTAEAGLSMRWPVIVKDPGAFPVPPNLRDYDDARATFTWDAARRALDGLPGGGLNIAHEAVARHAAGPRRDHEALRFVRADGSTRSHSYADLAELSARFAGVLNGLGV